MVMVVLDPKVTEELSANRICTLPEASVRKVSWASMESLRARAISCPPLSTKTPGTSAVTWPMGAARTCPAHNIKNTNTALNRKNILMGSAPFWGASKKGSDTEKYEKCLAKFVGNVSPGTKRLSEALL